MKVKSVFQSYSGLQNKFNLISLKKMNDLSTPTFESFEPPTRTFSIQSLLSNVIYIEIGCNKVNTKNENIFNFIDDRTVCLVVKPR